VIIQTFSYKNAYSQPVALLFNIFLSVSIGDEKPLGDVIYDAEDDDVSFDVESRDDDNVFPYFDDQLVEDSFEAEDDVYVGNKLTGCHNGKCERCFKMWRLKGTSQQNFLNYQYLYYRISIFSLVKI
jgi:hypothetical protein